MTERKAQVAAFFNEIVTVTIDRPIGAIHPKHPEIIYPINYGYIEGVIAPDGEELDVYVMGVEEPLREFTGRVIGIVHREDDVEDKLVAALDGAVYTQNEIAEAVHFQEQFHRSTIQAVYHKSVGVIVFRRREKETEYLVLFQKESKTWSFPKGHMEPFETEIETAKRELLEETALRLEFIDGFREEIRYKISDVRTKTVVLYLAEFDEGLLSLESEIEEARWVAKAEACSLLKHEKYREILEKAEAICIGK